MGRVIIGVAVCVAVAACSVAAVVVGRRVRIRRKWTKVVGVLKELEEACDTSVERLRQVVDAMAVEMHAGLASEGGSKLKMLLTFVDKLPNGSEKGIYHALDLGGTNFRVLRVLLQGQRSTNIQHDVHRQRIPQSLMAATSQDLFDFIASSLKDFVDKEDGHEPELEKRKDLGFAFSFPVRKTSLSSGLLIKWTKAFSIKDMVGKDVTSSLQEALARYGLDMIVTVLINDTVGTLTCGYYHDPDTVAAVVVGTGTNAAYIERTDAIIKCQGLLAASGSVGFEKMISGLYLGDIVRRVILRMSQETDVFATVSAKLTESFVLSTSLIAAMHDDDSSDLREVARILRDVLEIPDVCIKARKIVVKVCDVVTRRAARLVSAGTIGILKKIGRDGSGGITGGRRNDVKMKRTVVAIDGGLYTGYTAFREYMHEALIEILGEDIARHVILRVTEDGPGVGAALLAASYSTS